MNAEQLRESFRPKNVRVLFVGESPPAGGTFFYAGDSGLYRSTRDAFADAFPDWNRGDTFLERFSRAGCYLDDLCHQPVNHYRRNERLQARREGEARLAKTIAELQPQILVVLLKSIVQNVARAVRVSGCDRIETHVLTYPSRWHFHRAAYRGELSALLSDLSNRGIICAP